MFFSNSLSDSIDLKYQPWWSGPNGGLLGKVKRQGDNGRVTIWIFDHHTHFKDFQQRRRRILGTLIHELIHSVMRSYSCYCSECMPHIGITGHGISFEIVAQAVENVMNSSKMRIDDKGSAFEV